MSEMLDRMYFPPPIAEAISHESPSGPSLLHIARSYEFDSSKQLDAYYDSCVTCADDQLDDALTEYVNAYYAQRVTYEKIHTHGLDDLNTGLDIVLCSIYVTRQQYSSADKVLRGVIQSVTHATDTTELPQLLIWQDHIDMQLRLLYEQQKQHKNTSSFYDII